MTFWRSTLPRAWRRRFSALLLGAFASAPLASGAGSHCAGVEVVVAATESHGHHAQPPAGKDRTPAHGEECPHCPPADCLATPACAAAVAALPEGAALPRGISLGASPAPVGSVRPHSLSLQPPTPPPQVPFRAV